MTIPLILEVAIGIIFIYLTLSLLASEIQEIIGTLLQWRAEHLKRSVEVLLSGNDQSSRAAAQALADRLYERPMIRSLNQEASGGVGHFFRRLTQVLGNLYRTLTRTRGTFGRQTSGPSYIPADTFSQALLESLQLDALRHLLIESRLLRFLEDKVLLPLNHMVNDLRASTANEFLLNAELKDLEQAFSQLVGDFQEDRATLVDTLTRLLQRLDEFAERAQEVLPDHHHLSETFMRRLRYLRRSLASTQLDQTALLRALQPSLTELVSVLDSHSPLYRELKVLAGKDGGRAKAILEQLDAQPLPDGLRASLRSLAERASQALATQTHETLIETVKSVAETEPVTHLKLYLTDLESDVKLLGQEVEAWFNRGMDRAAGVYRRNAKAVSILIGIAIAVAINADSFHIVDRLAKDPTIRSAVNQAATQVAAADPSPETLEQLQSQVDSVLAELPLPLGYSDTVVQQQRAAQAEWFLPVIPRRVVGWLVTGIAISMGAGFWFNLLKRVIDIKTSGKDPQAPARK